MTTTHKQNPHGRISKEQTGNPSKNYTLPLIPGSYINQEEPIIYFTNTLIPQTTIFPKHKPWFTEEGKNIKEHEVTLRKENNNKKKSTTQ